MASVFHIQPGEMNRLVTVERKTESRGTAGDVIESWSTYATIWCKAVPGRGSEAASARRETGKLEEKFLCRYFPGLTLKMRLAMGNRYFDIVSIANIEERNKYYEITAIERI